MNFEQYRKQLQQLGADLDECALHVVNQMTNVGMTTTVKNTPVGQYPPGSGKVGGTLRRGWAKDSAHRVGNGVESRYYNNVYYGMYVNNGHRIVSKGVTTGFVKGKRMLEQGIDAAKRQSGAIFNEEIKRVKQKGGW